MDDSEIGNAIKSEVKCGESRFDFCIERAHACEKKEYIMKCVPLRKGEYSYFPEGYRKSKKETVSPRAIKHIEELIKIKNENNGA